MVITIVKQLLLPIGLLTTAVAETNERQPADECGWLLMLVFSTDWCCCGCHCCCCCCGWIGVVVVVVAAVVVVVVVAVVILGCGLIPVFAPLVVVALVVVAVVVVCYCQL